MSHPSSETEAAPTAAQLHAVRTFLTAHGTAEADGTGVRAVIEHLGRSGYRVVLIGADGTPGDVLVERRDAAEMLCERMGIAVAEWDRETSAALHISPEYRRAMAHKR